jgi:hypothetical protein
MRCPRCAGLLLSLRLIFWSGLVLTTASFREPGPPCPLPGSAAANLLGNLETKSADFLCQALRFSDVLSTRGGRSSPIRGVPPAPCSTGSCSVAPHGASELVPLLEARTAELSFSKLLSLCSISGPTSDGDIKVHQTVTPCLVRL